MGGNSVIPWELHLPFIRLSFNSYFLWSGTLAYIKMIKAYSMEIQWSNKLFARVSSASTYKRTQSTRTTVLDPKIYVCAPR